ncbi:MAG: arylsulfatase [Planctomycetota bacterium]
MQRLLIAPIALLAACSSPSEVGEPAPSGLVSTPSRSVDEIDRTVLPIQPPARDPITEMDARNVEAPERFEVRPPEGAPNVLVIMIDDIGFGATTPYGGPIRTPNFQRLADGGLRFNRFHTTALCSPTRAALLAGRNHHAINVGSVMEVATGFPGNQGERPDNAKYVAETLRMNGYNTAAFGKWHETAPWETSVSGPFFRWPTNSGFDKFYGFIGGETNQWEPMIYDGVARVEKKEDPDYHFTEDIADETIQWIRFQNAMTPDKPFMAYFATGAVHAPHHAPKEWIEKYRGQFDAGWDVLREQTHARQKQMGIIPADTVLSPKPPGIEDWDALSDDQKRLFTIQMETFAGFMEHTDHHVGRIIDAIEATGELDNTLIVYIMGDNGSSAEGGFEGTFNELIHLNGNFEAETIESMLARADDWGGPNSFPHMAAGWAVATDAPFTWTKQMAADFGGTRNGMVMHWPAGFSAKGGIRTQWHHVNDVAPTILEAAGLPEAKVINGVAQRPMDGVSMLYAAKDAGADERHLTQYFEMFGNRAIYHEGWLARAVHKAPWADPYQPFLEDTWELFDTTKDFSLSRDLAAEQPAKLTELKEVFENEAIRNNVYPLDDRVYERFNPAIAGRPDVMGDRTSLTLSEGMTGMAENAFINVKNSSKTISATLDLAGNDRGIILCQGGKFGGWAFYMNDGKPAYAYNWYGLETYTVEASQAVPKGTARVEMRFKYDGNGLGKGGDVEILVDGNVVATGRVEKTQPALFSADDTADVGVDEATQVADRVFSDMDDSEFTGVVESVTISIER